jgi:putative flippase GtrA
MTRSSGRQFLLFVLSGGAAALVNVLSRIGFSLVLRFELAVIAAYAVGMVTAYILVRCYVFTDSGQSVRRSFAAFALVNLVAVFQTWLVSIGLRQLLLPMIGAIALVDLMAHSVGVIVPVFTSYLGHKHVSFRSPRS